jgi:hypothetical protein
MLLMPLQVLLLLLLLLLLNLLLIVAFENVCIPTAALWHKYGIDSCCCTHPGHTIFDDGVPLCHAHRYQCLYALPHAPAAAACALLALSNAFAEKEVLLRYAACTETKQHGRQQSCSDTLQTKRQRAAKAEARPQLGHTLAHATEHLLPHAPAAAAGALFALGNALAEEKVLLGYAAYKQTAQTAQKNSPAEIYCRQIYQQSPRAELRTQLGHNLAYAKTKHPA